MTAMFPADWAREPVRLLAQGTVLGSCSRRLRQNRYALFRSLIADLPRPVRVLDVGGTTRFWDALDWADGSGVDVTLLNIDPKAATSDLFPALIADGRQMGCIGDGEYDLVFSNSTIEHVGGYEDQWRMTQEIMRVGRRYFVQTPNYHFPIEPHYMIPAFQYLPTVLKSLLLRWLGLTPYRAYLDFDLLVTEIGSIRLLSRNQLGRFFPDGVIVDEKVMGLTKSFIVCGGWSGAAIEAYVDAVVARSGDGPRALSGRLTVKSPRDRRRDRDDPR